ncbi:MAG: hypothetical protein VKJ24_16740 [Synechococcales bacterium]|nr:hypothetical protein [Synechococcales bacterium]
MSPSSSSPQPWRSLSIGNLVSASFQLYRNNLQPYLSISFQAALWSGLSLVLLLLVVGISFATSATDSAGIPRMPNWGVLILLLLVWIGIALYCSARTLACAGAISRLAYQELTNQPEASREASRFTQSRSGSFLGAAFLIGVIYLGLYIGFWIIFTVLALLLMGIFAGIGIATQQSSSAGVVAGIFTVGLVLVATLLVLLFLSWFSARLSIWELPIAVERDATASNSIGRSMSLTKGNAWRIVIVLFVGFLITLPLFLLIQLGSWVVDLGLARFLADTDPLFQILSTLFGYLIGILGNIFLLPFWQALKAMIYYDLKVRREGLGLELGRKNGA